MYVDNITSENMTLTYEGKAMQIKVYEDLIKEKDKEIERLNNIIKEADKRIYEYNNTIREVREYIENERMYYEDNFTNEDIVKTKPLLEILDKAGVDKE